MKDFLIGYFTVCFIAFLAFTAWEVKQHERSIGSQKDHIAILEARVDALTLMVHPNEQVEPEPTQSGAIVYWTTDGNPWTYHVLNYGADTNLRDFYIGWIGKLTNAVIESTGCADKHL